MCCNYFPVNSSSFSFSQWCVLRRTFFHLMSCNLSKRSLVFSVFHIFSYVSNVISLAFMFGYVIHPRLTLCAWTIGVEACLVLCVYPVVSNPLIEGFLSSHCLVWVPQLKKTFNHLLGSFLNSFLLPHLILLFLHHYRILFIPVKFSLCTTT